MDIDKLQIEIEANSSNASGELDKLADSLSNLGGNLQNVGQLRSFSTALKNLSNVASDNKLTNLTNLGDKIKRMADGFTAFNGFKTGATGFLKQLENLNALSKSIGKDNTITNFTKQVEELATALEPLKDLGKTNLGSFFNQLKKLPDISNELDKVSFSKFTAQMQALANSIKPLEGIQVRIGKAFSNLPWHIKKASSQLDGYSKSAQKAGNSSSSFFSKLGKGVASFRTLSFITQAVVGTISDMFEESSQYVENLNLFNVAMGNATQSALAYANKVQDKMGIDVSEWMSYQGKLNSLITGFDVTSDKAQIMSQNLTQLAYDYSSLFNVDVSSAFDKLNSAMSGQIKGLKDFGNNVSVAMVKETGLKYGLQGSVSDWDQNTQAIMRYITIMNNASKVDVFNDMARTLVTPANSIRILTQQFNMLKRAIGNIASVFITKLVPYVQVAIKWLTALANTIAGFFGFELPEIDYSGISAGGSDALDDVADSADNASDSVGKTNDKVKELKKQLMGFDELNILNAPDDDSDSGSGGSGGSGGGGGGSIGDISLPQYDFLKGLEDNADELAKRLEKLFADIFKPVTDSWNQYGKEVVDSFEYKWREIGKLIESVGKSFNEVWQNGTGKKSIDDILQITINLNKTVGNLAHQFRIAWDSANTGTAIIQNLWNGVNNLLDSTVKITGMLEKSTKTLDFKPSLNSVKELSEGFEQLTKIVGKYFEDAFKNTLIPLGKWTIEKGLPSLISTLANSLKAVANTMSNLRPLVTLLEKATTVLVKLGGSVILGGLKTLSKTLELVASNKFTLTALISTITALIACMKFGQVSNDLNKLQGGFGLLKMAVMDVKNLGITGMVQSWSQVFLNSHSSLNNLVSGFQALNSTEGVLSGVSTGLITLAGKLSVASEGTGVLAGLSGTLASAFTFLATNPLVAVAGGLAIATGAMLAFAEGGESTYQKHQKLVDSITKVTDKLKEEADSFKKSNEEADKKAQTAQNSSVILSDYANRLSKITDENGKITGSVQLAQQYVDKLNSELGTNIQIHDGVIENWQEEKKAIYENIEALKQKAIVEAYEQEYVKAVKEEATARAELTEAQNKYNEAKALEKAKLDEINEAIANGKPVTDQQKLDYQNLTEQTGLYKDQLNEAKNKVAEINEATDNYNSAVQALDGTVESSANSICAQYGKMDTDGSYTFKSLAQGLNDLDKKCDENGERWKQLSETEREASKKAREQLLSDLATKSFNHTQTYEQMLKTAKEKGAKLTQADKDELKKQYDNLVKNGSDKLSKKGEQYRQLLNLLDKYGIDTNSKTGKRYAQELKDAQENGTKQGQKYIDNLSKSISNDGKKVNTETEKIAKKNKENIEKQEAKLKVNTSEANKNMTNFLNKIPKSKTLNLDFTTAKKALKIGDQSFGIILKTFANGGFPENGQLFMANEAGPELVGRIGRRTAVANNDQITQAITQAVLRGLGGSSTGGGSSRFVIQNVLDKKVISETVFEYHNGKVKQTGKSPLII